MFLTAASIQAHNILTASQAPYYAAAGRWAQIALALVLALTLPVDNVALRMLLALSIGEIAGYAPLAYYGTWKLVPATGRAYHLVFLGWSLLATVTAAAITAGCLSLAPNRPLPLFVALGAATILIGLVAPIMGVGREWRQALIERVVRPRLALLVAAIRSR